MKVKMFSCLKQKLKSLNFIRSLELVGTTSSKSIDVTTIVEYVHDAGIELTVADHATLA